MLTIFTFRQMNNMIRITTQKSVSFWHILLVSCIIITAYGCGSAASEKKRIIKPVDQSITQTNAFINIFLDSNAINKFIAGTRLGVADSASMLSFYRDRNYQYAWFDSAGMTEQAPNFINLYRSYRQSLNDSSLFVAALDTLVDKWLLDSGAYRPSATEIERTELLLTRHFFKYAEKAYAADETIDVKDLGWFIPKKKMDPRQFLDSVMLAGGRDIKQLLPVAPLFESLRKALDTYTAISKANSFQSITFLQPKYQLGDSAAAIGEIKRRLQLLGDLPATDTGNVFTKATSRGVMQFQQRMGLTADSVAGKSFLAEINVPIEKRIQQILINMERARWIPKPGNGAFIFVNIPEFKLHAFDSGKQQLEMAVVVGKPASNTVIFNGTMQYVVFAPYWNVPYSIVKNEMGRTASYFSKRNMEVVGKYGDGLPIVRQKPGPSNSLGRVKFLFPNSYSIYLHDTPSKSLFGETKRAFSHGCIRVQQPEKLAQWVLRNNPEWTNQKIAAALQLSKELTVNVANPIPVFIGYFTCWIDQEGRLNFRNDIYGHDEKLGNHLFHAK